MIKLQNINQPKKIFNPDRQNTPQGQQLLQIEFKEMYDHLKIINTLMKFEVWKKSCLKLIQA